MLRIPLLGGRCRLLLLLLLAGLLLLLLIVARVRIVLLWMPQPGRVEAAGKRSSPCGRRKKRRLDLIHGRVVLAPFVEQASGSIDEERAAVDVEEDRRARADLQEVEQAIPEHDGRRWMTTGLKGRRRCSTANPAAADLDVQPWSVTCSRCSLSHFVLFHCTETPCGISLGRWLHARRRCRE